MKHPIFEFLTLVVIIWNSIILAIDSNDPIVEDMELAFLILYTIEMTLKIFGLGFIFNRNAYLRDYWNILDFIIVTTSYLPFFFNSNSVNLSALRSLRVLRPLRTISSVKSLKTIILALFSSFTLLIDSLIILLFFYMIFAIAGLQLLTGVLKRRCFVNNFGIEKFKILNQNEEETYYCQSTADCDKLSMCGKMFNNPNWDITSFDSFMYAFLQVYFIFLLFN